MRLMRFRRPDPAWLLLGVAAAVVLLLKLGYARLFLFDESLYCGTTADMATHGQWLYPTEHGQFYGIYGKPPLINWLQAASAHIFGWSIFSLRLPTALGMLALILLTGRTALVLLGRRAGLVAATLIILSARMVHTGRHILLEDIVAPLFAASLLLYTAALHRDEPLDRATASGASSWLLVIAAGLCMALAVLTKQAFALFAPAAIVAAELILRRPGWLRRLSLVAFVTFVASAWWFVASYRAVGAPFVDSLLGYHVQARFGAVLEGHARGLNAYGAALDDHLRVLPWAFAAVGWVAIYPRLTEAWQRFLFVAWSALAVIEFVVVGLAIKTFLPWYQIVVMPPLFIGAAHAILAFFDLSSAPRWVRWSVPLAAAAAIATSARLDAIVALAAVAGLALLAARSGRFDKVPTTTRELVLITLAGVLGVVVANPWHGGDGRYKVAQLMSARHIAPADTVVVGDEWRRVWRCYAPDVHRVEWSGSCDDIADQTQRARYLILDGEAAACSIDAAESLLREKTKQGDIALYVRTAALR